jgi:hypothetical protein
MNNILKKMAQMERNAQEINLAKHEVKLATIYDDLRGTLDQANVGFIKALDLKSQAAKLCKESLTKNQAILKELDKVESLIKQIGLDSELKKVQAAKSEVNKNMQIIDTAYNNFLSI